MRRFNLPLLFLLIVVIILASTISYQTLNQTDASDKHLRTGNKEIAESQELKRLLRGIASDDNVIIVTMLDSASVSFLDMFMESFHVGEGTKALLSFVLISATDQMAFDRCRAVHTHCYFLGYNYNLVNKDKNFEGGDDIITHRMTMMMKAQVELLQRILDVGYSLIYTDVDVMWFRNPLPYFDPLHLLILSTDFSDVSPSPNGGFIYARSCSQTVDFFRYWRVLWRLHTDLDRRAILSLALRPIQGGRPPFGLPIHFLDTAFFGGFCEHGQDWGKIGTMQANCCSSAEEKLHGLRALVRDWKNYTAQSNSNWNVPKYRCKNA